MLIDTAHRFLQFELWKDCRNGCPFCQNRGLGDVDKYESLTFVYNTLCSSEIDRYNEVGFIGGEFFDGQLNDKDVKHMFYKCVDKVIEKMHINAISKFYVTATLIQNDPKDLVDFIGHIIDSNVQNKFLLCTSYDTKYRFSEYRKESTWINTIKTIHELFPEINIHTEIIVTEDFVNKVVSKALDLTWFNRELNTQIDFIEPHSGFYYKDKYEFDRNIPDFLLKRKSFLKFLMFLKKNFPNDINMLFNKNLKSNDFYIHYKNGKLIKFENRRGNKDRTCNVEIDHIPHWGYIDSDVDIADDVEEFRRSING